MLLIYTWVWSHPLENDLPNRVTPPKETGLSYSWKSSTVSSTSARGGAYEPFPVSFVFVDWPDVVFILYGQPQRPRAHECCDPVMSSRRGFNLVLHGFDSEESFPLS